MRLIVSIAVALLLDFACHRAVAAEASQAPKTFQPTWDSLKNYRCPDWFRDAKFGIWAHWGPQAVPMAGDWYARYMYDQGSGQYKHHLEHYGHPSEHGYQEIIQFWKAEKFDPGRLMALYKKAGARYFVSMGSHHDNFHLWNSKFHRWNAVKMGPHRDIVGDWQKAAQKEGLPFGVSEHLAASYTWWQNSHGADKTGPKAHLAYDGANPALADLYHSPAFPNDRDWYSRDANWHNLWSLYIHDLVEHYHPDLLYSDGGLPFGITGRQLLADYYNDSIAQHGGRLEAVYTCKKLHPSTENEQFVPGTCVLDMERGLLSGISSEPWQTDTSIGDWFYNKNWHAQGAKGMYRSPEWVIRTLVDIVSKNGNLLLNVILRPDGSLDGEVEQLLGHLGDWTAVNGEAIYGSRPWKVYGEGPASVAGGSHKEDFNFTADDVRFTSKPGVVYAICLGAPAKAVRIKALADAKIETVSLLGTSDKLNWKQRADALVIEPVAHWPSPYAVTFRVQLKQNK